MCGLIRRRFSLHKIVGADIANRPSPLPASKIFQRRNPAKAPSSKHQAPGKHQTSSSKAASGGASVAPLGSFGAVFEVWNLKLLSSLVLGIWSFLTATFRSSRGT